MRHRDLNGSWRLDMVGGGGREWAEGDGMSLSGWSELIEDIDRAPSSLASVWAEDVRRPFRCIGVWAVRTKGGQDLEREASERVAELFAEIDEALYEGAPLTDPEMAQEVADWARFFPHIRVIGRSIALSHQEGASTSAAAARPPSATLANPRPSRLLAKSRLGPRLLPSSVIQSHGFTLPEGEFPWRRRIREKPEKTARYRRYQVRTPGESAWPIRRCRAGITRVRHLFIPPFTHYKGPCSLQASWTGARRGDGRSR